MEHIVDWDSVELDYRSAILSNADICRKHGITVSVLSRTASSMGWAQVMRTPEEEADILAMAPDYITPQLEARFPVDSLFTADDVKKKNLMTAGQVVATHRKDVADLREITENMTTRLKNYLGDPDNDDAKRQLLQILGAKEGPSDLLEKMSRVLTRLVTVEREAYGMTTLFIDNDVGEEDMTAKKIEELKQSLIRITHDKAQKKDEISEPPPKPDPAREKKKVKPPVTKQKPLVES